MNLANSKWIRNGFIYGLIVVAIIAVLYSMLGTPGRSEEISISTVVEWSKLNRIKSIVVDGDVLAITRTDGQLFKSRKEGDASILSILKESGVNTDPGAGGVDVWAKSSSGMGKLFGTLLTFLPLIFFGALLLFMMRQAQGSNNQTLNFGRSKARLSANTRPTVKFVDVAGMEEAKQELQEVVEFLRYPERFMALGARIPRGVVLVGPPGTGKTLLARAVAGEAGVPFFSISGSEFVEMFVGVGAARVRDLFDQAKRNTPCIVFVDEIDAVGRHRGAGLGGGHDEREQTLNQILVEMDGFDSNANIIIIAATNRPDILDPALLRPGRFDRRVVLDLPDINGRQAILAVHSKGKPFSPDVEMISIAKQTPGFSGADLANIINEGALLAARRNKTAIETDDLEEAIDRIIAGPERKGRVINPHEKEITAYHEAGHALVANILPHADPVHKISIVARGGMGGYTRLLPVEDRYLWTKLQFKDMITVSMGGRVAEELIFKEITTGASNDIENATKMALRMIKQYGMSERLGLRTFGKRQELVFLGREITEERDYSDHIAEQIDNEVEMIIQKSYDAAQEILRENVGKLVQMAQHLIANETVEGVALKQLFDSKVPEEAVQLASSLNGNHIDGIN